MNNIEEKLNKIKMRSISEEEKDSLWHKIAVAHTEEERNGNKLSFNVFNFKMNRNKIIAGVLTLVLILGGGGVAAASNKAMPGDFLFPVDLALEKAQIKIVSQDKKIELKRKFAHERVSEVRSLVEKRGSPDIANTVVLSTRENDDVGRALTSINAFLDEDEDSQDREELRKSFNDLLVVLGDDKNVKIEKKDGEIKIKSDDGKIEIKLENKNNDNSGKSSDDGADDDINDDRNISDPSKSTDVRESDDEEFCRGEWRDVEDCDDSLDSDDEDDGDDSDDDEDDSSDDDDSDDDSSGRGRGGDDD